MIQRTAFHRNTLAPYPEVLFSAFVLYKTKGTEPGSRFEFNSNLKIVK